MKLILYFLAFIGYLTLVAVTAYVWGAFKQMGINDQDKKGSI